MGKTQLLDIIINEHKICIYWNFTELRGWGGGRVGWGCPTLVRRSHFNMETSASLNSGFNVLEALRFLLQLFFFFLFIHDFFFFLYSALKMSLTSPQVPSCSRCTVDPWQTGGFGSSCLGAVCSPGVAWETATLEQCCPFASHSHQLSPPFLFV